MNHEEENGLAFFVGIVLGVIAGIILVKTIPAKFDKDDLLKRGIIEYNQNSGKLQYNEKYESK